MEKIVHENQKLGSRYFEIKHPTGLTLLLCPDQKFNSAYAIFGTNYGSVDTTFRIKGEGKEFESVPEGIAHYLEHKLFESEDGDAFARYAVLGASANAFTSFDKTCYLFSATDHIYESLEVLLDFVQSPYFTKETVEKEQGIIGQEIKMYDDDPNWQVYFRLLRALYKEHPVRIDIAGTVESIAQITDKLLYQCYNTFYNLNNMVLAFAGNFEVDKAMEVIDKTLKPCPKLTIERKTVEEPREVCEHRTEVKLPVSMPLFCIGFKEEPDRPEDFIKGQVLNEMLQDILTAESSPLFGELYKEGLINMEFDSEVVAGRGYLASVFEGESKDPDAVYARILEELDALRKNGIPKDRFERAKKALYGKYVRLFNSVSGIANELVSAYFVGDSIYSPVELIEAITLEDVEERLKTTMLREYSAISIVVPAEEEA